MIYIIEGLRFSGKTTSSIHLGNTLENCLIVFSDKYRQNKNYFINEQKTSYPKIKCDYIIQEIVSHPLAYDLIKDYDNIIVDCDGGKWLNDIILKYYISSMVSRNFKNMNFEQVLVFNNSLINNSKYLKGQEQILRCFPNITKCILTHIENGISLETSNWISSKKLTIFKL